MGTSYLACSLLVQLARGMRPNKFAGLDRDGQEWKFQLEMYMAVASSTMAHDINTAETLTTPIKFSMGWMRRRHEPETPVPSVGQQLQEAGMILRGLEVGRQLAVPEIQDNFWSERIGNTPNLSFIPNEWQT